jgi:hypothetical protein
LIAVLGPKLQPTSHGCALYQSRACSAVQRSAAEAAAEMTHKTTAQQIDTTLFVR